ncbi:3-oxoacyl-[acyl-carrier-protein] reductase FabG [bioreactor metagenome]|uniref:3-oxoacyl-[acyl-carrier-protein] reductase FabG n=1 Tax=bioreactor metagenome TaxID=1076179 RepID=A0A645GGQ9_9ZZZZ
MSAREERELLLRRITEKFGSLEALVNNAGVAPEVRADLLDMSEESFDRVLDINLKGPFFLTQAVGRYFAERKIAGTIVNVGSVSATVASISRGEYCISKAGVAMATKLFAVKMAEFGVPVYEIRPGVIASDMTSVVKAKYDKLIAEGLTLQPRWGEPADIGRAVAMLLRGDLAYSTGQVINVDGGMEIGRL